MSEENTDLPQDEPKTYTQAELDALLEERTKPLKQKVDEFRQSNVKYLKEREDLESEARAKAEDARLKAEELARKAGDAEALEKSLSERFSVKELEYQEKLAQRDQLLLGERKNSDVNELLAIFTQEGREVGKQLLSTMVEASYGEDGRPVTALKGFDGNIVTTQIDAMKEHLKNNSAFKSLLSGVQINGGGATGSKTNSGSATKSNQALQDAKKNKDVNAYIGAALKQNLNKG